MRTSVERVGQRLGVPQIFVVVAVAACLLLLLLESRTPWDVSYVTVGAGSFMTLSSQQPLWGPVGSVLLVLAPLAALRSTWLGVLLVLPRLAMGAWAGLAWPWTAYAALVAVAVVSSWRRPRLAWLVAALALVEPLVAIATRGRMMTPGGSVEFGMFGQGTGELVVTASLYVVATGVVMLFPILLRHEAARDRDLREILRGRREVARDATVLEERARLARDLHDVVAHHVSLIAVRAETAPYSHPDLSPEARAAFAVIAEESRLALRELRSVLGVLKRTETAPRSPQPTAGDIARLVHDAESTGAVVESALDGLEAVTPTVGYVAYRVVQEALTNARRHAPDAAVEVAAHGDGSGGITIRVTNATTFPGDDTPIEHGQGITGMSERVAAAGGDIEVGVRDGLFVVDVRLPGPEDSGSDEGGAA